MNTADRSLALLDHALRRRFSFVRLGPDYGVLGDRLRRDGLDPAPLLGVVADLNAEIADPDFEIGISFFMGGRADLPTLMPSIWDGEILPYVREIMHARPDSARWSWEAVRPRLTAWYPAASASAP
ncbi:hypothetical protein [Methylobacterium sp. R2-1]|uniref:hypothetical protein n=1 Tax=Methylobacterium sp. R2-1 TaxID=2587064 RepID=UPI00160FFBAF|nr:hypothetical protein [Methylobacterium sp. R2-1]MBB2961943.1 hypothetical protein [Methylobacterium sp. R2-1]